MAIPIVSTRSDGKIGDGVYVSYQWRGDPADNDLCRMYIGTRLGGPILQYDADGLDKWDGSSADDITDSMGLSYKFPKRNFPDGAWTPIYSKGNYKRNCACGGNWAGHSLNLLGMGPTGEIDHGQKILIGGELTTPPEGIRGDGHLIEMPVWGSWAIFYGSAADALRARLTPRQIQQSPLPQLFRDHLLAETDDVIERVWEVIRAYKI